MDHSFLLIGLGNPGDRYTGTRHNVGFSFIDALVKRTGCTFRRPFMRPLEIASSCGAREGLLSSLIIVKPHTYMNRSGGVLPWIQRRYAFTPDRICVVVDNMDLPPGEVRMKRRGGSAGHNGLRSISAGLGSDDYLRIYFGVGRPDRAEDTVEHVLGHFDEAEERAVVDAISRVVNLLQEGNFQSVEQLISGVNERRRPAGGNT